LGRERKRCLKLTYRSGTRAKLKAGSDPCQSGIDLVGFDGWYGWKRYVIGSFICHSSVLLAPSSPGPARSAALVRERDSAFLIAPLSQSSTFVLVPHLPILRAKLTPTGQVIVIGATNRPDSVDPALRRPGRFDREFYFPLPNKEARKKIIKINTRVWDPPLEEGVLEMLAGATKGYGGADMRVSFRLGVSIG
jgi:hypothetical protein